MNNLQLAASTKNQTIGATIRATKQRRESQVCRQYELKVDKSHLGVRTLAHLNHLFLEAKWFYNHVLASGDIFTQDYRINPLLVKVHDGHFEEEVVAVLNRIEQKGGRVYLADSSLELGKQVSSFGGIIALLRYAVRA